jgi:hypothetical protein
VSFLESGLFLANARSFEDPWEGHVYHKIKAQPEKLKNLNAFISNRKQYVYINCWHSSNHESYAMWRIYGKDDAVAIHTDGIKLKDFLKNIFEYHKTTPLVLTPVEYCNLSDEKLPEIDQDNIYSISYVELNSERDKLWNEIMRQLFMYKPIAYKYEQEVRIIALDSEAPDFLDVSGKSNDKAGILVPVKLEEFVTGVTVAPWADSAFVSAVKSVSEKFGIPAEQVKQSTLFSQPDSK